MKESAKEGGQIIEDKRGRQCVSYLSGEKYDCQGYVGETRIGWMCSVDFCDELGEHAILKSGVPEGTKIYDSIEELVKARRCTTECGYTKVLIVALEIGQP